MFRINAMDHIVLNVPDINRSLAFYMDVLGLEPERLDQVRRGEITFPSVRVSADTVIDLFPMKPGEALGHDRWRGLDHRGWRRVVPAGALGVAARDGGQRRVRVAFDARANGRGRMTAYLESMRTE
jgi:catechol 2,3-dioxygenase-like lactoylglutathione lyase family enzyme